MNTENPTIFIVDDEPLLTKMLGDYIQEENPSCEVISFQTGEECLKNLDLLPDAIVLDYHLNSKEKEAANGIDILKEIKKIRKSLPVIMLSSQENYGVASRTIMHGAVHYVVKGKEAFHEISELLKANI